MNTLTTDTGTMEETVTDSRDDDFCHTTVISSTTEFDAAEQRWNELLENADVTVFQTFEWLRTWWKYYATKDFILNIRLYWLEDQLVGIAPLFIQRIRFLGIPVVRRLQFIGRGITDYVDMLIRRGYEHIVLTAFAADLASTCGEWDLFDIEDVNESSLLVKGLPALLELAGIRTYTYQGNVCPYIQLPASAEVLVAEMDQTTKHEFRRKLKRLQKKFRTDVEVFHRPEDDYVRAIEMFSKIHGARWQGLGYPSAFENPHHRAYHAEFCRKFAERNWLRMFFLKVEGEPVSVSFGFNFRKCIYMYQSNAHGPDEVMKCSPGSIIRKIAMVGGIEEGMEKFDYLRGDEPYKYKEWKASETKNYLLRSPSLRPAGRIRFVLYLGRELAGKMVDRTMREYFEFQRFLITPRSGEEKITYILAKVSSLLGIGLGFIGRNLPFGIRRDEQDNDGADGDLPGTAGHDER